MFLLFSFLSRSTCDETVKIGQYYGESSYNTIKIDLKQKKNICIDFVNLQKQGKDTPSIYRTWNVTTIYAHYNNQECNFTIEQKNNDANTYKLPRMITKFMPGVAFKDFYGSISISTQGFAEGEIEFSICTKILPKISSAVLFFHDNNAIYDISNERNDLLSKYNYVIYQKLSSNTADAFSMHISKSKSMLNTFTSKDSKYIQNNLPKTVTKQVSNDKNAPVRKYVVEFEQLPKIKYFLQESEEELNIDTNDPLVRNILYALIPVYIIVPWLIVLCVKCANPNRCYRAGFHCQCCYECNCCDCCHWCGDFCDNCCFMSKCIRIIAHACYKSICYSCCSEEDCEGSKSCDCCGNLRYYLPSIKNYDGENKGKYTEWCCARFNRACLECDSDFKFLCFIAYFFQGLAYIAFAPFIAISLCCHICYPCDKTEEEWENLLNEELKTQEYDQISERRKIKSYKNDEEVQQSIVPPHEEII